MDQNEVRDVHEISSAKASTLMQLTRRLDEYFAGREKLKEVELPKYWEQAVHRVSHLLRE
jgi:hypothetical protein